MRNFHEWKSIGIEIPPFVRNVNATKISDLCPVKFLDTSAKSSFRVGSGS